MIDGVLYGSNGIGLVEAFHPGDGQDSGFSSRSPTSRSRAAGDSTRSVAYWTDGTMRAAVRHPRRISDRARSAHRAAGRRRGATAGGST